MRGSRHGKSGFFTSLRVGLFLALRQVRRTSKWTNVLVTFIMTLTFLNLVVVSGVLVGLIEGVVRAVGDHYLGDVIISNLKQKAYIEQSPHVIDIAKATPGVKLVTARYLESGTVEANYKTKIRETDLDESTGATFAGIDPVAEDAVTGLSKLVVEGEYLEPNDFDQIVVGAYLLKKYLEIDSSQFRPLAANVGDKVRITVGGVTREVTIKGVIKSKVDEIDMRAFMTATQLRGMIGRGDYNVDEIVLRLEKNADPVAVRDAIIAAGAGQYAKVQTREDAEPKFVKDMKATFNMLGGIISSIGLVVAIITIFIIIFINAITRRKFIGILKGIGVEARAIEIAYVFQSVFYAVLGTVFGLLIVYGFLEPYLLRHPINFPFSDGILVAPWGGTMIRVLVLVLATFVAGYMPAKIVVRQNTLDSILNR